MKVESGKNTSFLTEIAHFFNSLREKSKVPVDVFCTKSHVSTRTYYKIMRYERVKSECYFRLFIGIIRMATYENFMEHWTLLGERFYWKYSEE